MKKTSTSYGRGQIVSPNFVVSLLNVRSSINEVTFNEKRLKDCPRKGVNIAYVYLLVFLIVQSLDITV